MPQTIQDFYRVAQQRGFARDFMMRVRSIGETSFNEDDFVYVTTKTLPGRDITNQAVAYMGLSFNAPGTVKYPGSEGWTLRFRADRNGIIRQKLENWQINEVFDDSTSTGDLSLRGTDKVIQLDLIDESQNVLNTYKLFGVYIQSIAEVTGYDNAGDGKPLEFDVKLAYQYWRHEAQTS